MIRIKSVLSGEFLDLKQDTKIGITYAVSDFGKIETRQGFSSNEFDLLVTSHNLGGLGFPDNINNFNKINPFQKIDVLVYKNETIIGQGYLQINAVADTIKATFYGGNTDWFKNVNDFIIQDCDLSLYAHVWNFNNVQTLSVPIENALGLPLYYPKVDYGLLENRTQKQFFANELYPAFKVKELVLEIFKNFNYKVKGAFLDDIYFDRMCLPYSSQGKPKYPEGFFGDGEFFAINGNINYFPDLNVVEFIDLDIFSLDIIKSGWAKNDKYITKLESIFYNFAFEFSYLTLDIQFTSVKFLAIDDFGTPTQIAYFFYDFGNQEWVFANVQVEFFEFGFTCFFSEIVLPNISGITLELVPSAMPQDVPTLRLDSIKITPQNPSPQNEINFEKTIYPEWFLPKIKFGDLLKSLVNIFGLYFRFDEFEQTIYIESFEKIGRNINYDYLDWTEKTNFGSIDFDYNTIPQKYFQNSQWKYKLSTDDTESQKYLEFYKKEFGSYNLQIQNDFIEKQGEIFESVFSPTLTRKTFGGTTSLPYIPCFNSAGQAKNPNPRFIIFGDLVQIEDISNVTTYKLDSTDYSVLDFSYFQKDNLGILQDTTYTQSFEFSNSEVTQLSNGVSQTYLKLLFEILQKPALIMVDMVLNEVDISTFDFTKPIWIGGNYNAYFYVNRIIEFGSNELTKVELIKL